MAFGIRRGATLEPCFTGLSDTVVPSQSWHPVTEEVYGPYTILELKWDSRNRGLTC